MARGVLVSRLVVGVCLVMIASAGPGAGAEEWVGKRVVLKIEARPTATEGEFAGRRLHDVFVVKSDENGKLRIQSENDRDFRATVGTDEVVAYEKAFDYYTHAIEADPRKPDLFILRGVRWQNERHDLDKALADFNEAVRLDPSDALAHEYRGLVWGKKQDHDRAIADFNDSIRLDPTSATSYNNRGVEWRARKLYAKALADFSVAILLDPRLPDIYANRGGLQAELRDYGNALADFDMAIHLGTKDAQTFINRGRVRAVRKDFDKALLDFDEALRLGAVDDQAYLNRGLVWFLRKDYDKAVRDLSEAIRLDPNNSQAHQYRGYSWDRMKQYAHALADYDRAVDLDPRNQWNHYSRAWLLATCPDPRCRDGAKAVESAQKACEISRYRRASYLGALAAAYAESGDFAAAVKWQTKALEELKDEKLTPNFQARLKLYQEKKPYRDVQ